MDHSERLKALDKKLNMKQRKFVRAYVSHWNGAQAVRDAGYSPKYAKEAAAQLLYNPKVKAWVDCYREDLEAVCSVSVTRNIERLALIAYGSKEDLKKGGVGQVKVSDRNKAIEMLNRMLGYNKPEKVEMSGPQKIIGMVIEQTDAQHKTDFQSDETTGTSS